MNQSRWNHTARRESANSMRSHTAEPSTARINEHQWSRIFWEAPAGPVIVRPIPTELSNKARGWHAQRRYPGSTHPPPVPTPSRLCKGSMPTPRSIGISFHPLHNPVGVDPNWRPGSRGSPAFAGQPRAVIRSPVGAAGRRFVPIRGSKSPRSASSRISQGRICTLRTPLRFIALGDQIS